MEDELTLGGDPSNTCDPNWWSIENWSMVIQNGRLGPGGPYNQLVGETYSSLDYLKPSQ